MQKPVCARHGAPPAAREQRIERRAGRGFCGVARLAGKQPGFECGGDVEDIVADRDAAARCAPCGAEHPERQVLHREFAVLVGRGDPAARCRIMRFVERGHNRSSPAFYGDIRGRRRREPPRDGSRRPSRDC
jgi:hypothetical protein